MLLQSNLNSSLRLFTWVWFNRIENSCTGLSNCAGQRADRAVWEYRFSSQWFTQQSFGHLHLNPRIELMVFDENAQMSMVMVTVLMV